ncbi:MAG: hypothetical protein KC474_04850 [Cyanobacteria bacterium HKST-UBA04]|nr:hypothetical protein [Cyanobacteria bacterium HKST-UBA04]MCA9840651.1 hypothetical protein [Cyanobacteria bacterium HKST-UBA03]
MTLLTNILGFVTGRKPEGQQASASPISSKPSGNKETSGGSSGSGSHGPVKMKAHQYETDRVDFSAIPADPNQQYLV